jgi:hypothetical protein
MSCECLGARLARTMPRRPADTFLASSRSTVEVVQRGGMSLFDLRLSRIEWVYPHEQGMASRAHALLEGIAPVVADGAGVVGAGKLGVARFVADVPTIAGARI